MREAFLRRDLEQVRELARREWSEGLETCLALGCFLFIVVTVGGLTAISLGVLVVLEHIL